jgi:hypothetical protein
MFLNFNFLGIRIWSALDADGPDRILSVRAIADIYLGPAEMLLEYLQQTR